MPVVSVLPILVTPERAAALVPILPPKLTPPVESAGVLPAATAFKSMVAKVVPAAPIFPVIEIVPEPASISRSSVVLVGSSVPLIVTFAPPPVAVSIATSPLIVVLPVISIAPSDAVVIAPFNVVGPVIFISSISVLIAFTVTAAPPPSRLVISVTALPAVP